MLADVCSTTCLLSVSAHARTRSIIRSWDVPSGCRVNLLSNLTDFVPLLQYLPNSMKTRTKKLHKDVEWRYDKDG